MSLEFGEIPRRMLGTHSHSKTSDTRSSSHLDQSTNGYRNEKQIRRPIYPGLTSMAAFSLCWRSEQGWLFSYQYTATETLFVSPRVHLQWQQWVKIKHADSKGYPWHFRFHPSPLPIDVYVANVTSDNPENTRVHCWHCASCHCVSSH